MWLSWWQNVQAERFKHLLTAPNATYLSPQYISSMIQVMSDYVKQPLHNILKTFNFSFYSDETTKITSTEQFVV